MLNLIWLCPNWILGIYDIQTLAVCASLSSELVDVSESSAEHNKSTKFWKSCSLSAMNIVPSAYLLLLMLSPPMVIPIMSSKFHIVFLYVGKILSGDNTSVSNYTFDWLIKAYFVINFYGIMMFPINFLCGSKVFHMHSSIWKHFYHVDMSQSLRNLFVINEAKMKIFTYF